MRSRASSTVLLPQPGGPMMAKFAPRRAPTDRATKTSVQNSITSSPLFSRTAVIMAVQRPPHVHGRVAASRSFEIRSAG